MIKYSACIEALYRDVPFVDRIEKVAAVGMKAFEFWGWGNKDIDAVKAAKDEFGLKVATFGADVGGPLVDPSNRDKLPEGLKRSVEVAHKLDCKRLLVTTGNEIQGVRRGEQHQSIVDGLRMAAEIVEAGGVTLCLEPLNVLVNHKGYYLYTSAEGFQIVEQVDSPNVRLLYDIYHQQITEGNLIATISANISKIAHFHVADVPGRHEPGTGEINYRNVFKSISESGYDGFVGLEFWPECPDDDALRALLDMAADI